MILTVGHSTLSRDEFSALLVRHGTDELWDIRSHPGSRNYPQFNKESLQISGHYRWVPALGGWNHTHAGLIADLAPLGVDVACYCRQGFPKQRIAKELPHHVDEVSWWNQGLRDYSFFMALPEFMDAAAQLVKEADTQNIAIMCSEAQWWRCHRSMVADYLCSIGSDAMHIMGNKLVPHSTVLSNRLERYDPRIRKVWEDHNGRASR